MGRFVNIVAFCSKPEQEGKPFPGEPVQEASREEVLQQFSGWEDEVVKLLEVSSDLRYGEACERTVF